MKKFIQKNDYNSAFLNVPQSENDLAKMWRFPYVQSTEILTYDVGGLWKVRDDNQLRVMVSSDTVIVIGHIIKIWSILSLLDSQDGHVESSVISLLRSKTLEGKTLWQSCHKQSLILGMTSTFQIQLNSQGGWSRRWEWDIHVVDLVEN